MTNYEPVIGLEVHVQLNTNSKLFCGCSTKFGADPNEHTCPVCLGLPGTLPVINRQAVEDAIALGLATGCGINERNIFARKNYFYPDLPKGYQTSQFELPICEHGELHVDLAGGEKRIGITRIHMEEDAGKLIHGDDGASYVDLNRAGTPCLECVSEPDIRSIEEAGAYLRRLHMIVRYLGISDGNMEQGSFRCDANISLRPVGQEEFGTRAEVKNMNSFKNVERAIEYEIRRQEAVLRDGGEIIQETRLWDADAGHTRSMRGKEEAHDYRYFPEPDLLPVIVTNEWISQVEKTLPEFAVERAERFKTELGLSDYDAETLCADKPLADFFEQVVAGGAAAKAAANYVLNDITGKLNDEKREIADAPVTPALVAELIGLIDKGAISSKIAKEVFEQMWTSGGSPAEIVKSKGLEQISDEGALLAVIDEIIAANAEQVRQFRDGKTKVLGFFVGQVMKATKGKADPGAVNKLLKEKLAG